MVHDLPGNSATLPTMQNHVRPLGMRQAQSEVLTPYVFTSLGYLALPKRSARQMRHPGAADMAAHVR